MSTWDSLLGGGPRAVELPCRGGRGFPAPSAMGPPPQRGNQGQLLDEETQVWTSQEADGNCGGYGGREDGFQAERKLSVKT